MTSFLTLSSPIDNTSGLAAVGVPPGVPTTILKALKLTVSELSVVPAAFFVTAVSAPALLASSWVVIGPEDGLDAPYGIKIREGQLYVCSRVQQRIWKVVLATRAVSVWWDATGIAGPRDIVFRESDAIVTDSDGHDLERLSLDGQWLETWVDSNGVTTFNFPVN